MGLFLLYKGKLFLGNKMNIKIIKQNDSVTYMNDRKLMIIEKISIENNE